MIVQLSYFDELNMLLGTEMIKYIPIDYKWEIPLTSVTLYQGRDSKEQYGNHVTDAIIRLVNAFPSKHCHLERV